MMTVDKVVHLLNTFYSHKVWTRDDVDRAHRTGPKSGDNDRPRPLIARLHRWCDKMSVLQQTDERKEMSDTLNIRVATDVTDRQSSILREEKNAGRQAYFHNGRLHYKENRSPRRKFRRSSETRRHGHRATDDAPRYFQRTEQAAPSRNKTPDDRQTPPPLYDMEHFPMIHSRRSGNGAHSSSESQKAPDSQQQRASHQGE